MKRLSFFLPVYLPVLFLLCTAFSTKKDSVFPTGENPLIKTDTLILAYELCGNSAYDFCFNYDEVFRGPVLVELDTVNMMNSYKRYFTFDFKEKDLKFLQKNGIPMSKLLSLDAAFDEYNGVTDNIVAFDSKNFRAKLDKSAKLKKQQTLNYQFKYQLYEVVIEYMELGKDTIGIPDTQRFTKTLMENHVGLACAITGIKSIKPVRVKPGKRYFIK